MQGLCQTKPAQRAATSAALQKNNKQRRSVIRIQVRVNNRIRVPQVRCIGMNGEMLGVIPTSEALKRAFAAGVDLVEISPSANPPVCRIMNFGKFKYEESRKEKMARKQQAGGQLKEVKFHANTEEHDYQTKLRHIHEFLAKGHRVKSSLMFRGRENEHRDLGFELFKRLIKDCEAAGVAEFPPKLMGNNLMLLLRPQSGPKKTETSPQPAGQPQANP